MARKHPGETTLPADGSTFGREMSDPLLLVWLFPRTDGPVLDLRASVGGSEAVIGRDDTCAVALPGHDVSRRHASVRSGSVPLITDLSSRNGTFVNGRRIKASPLGLNDVVRVGGWVGVVTRAAGPLGSLAPDVYGGPLLREALAAAERASKSDLPIIIEGETGTGKEVVARAIHTWSSRSGAFIAVNCGALPEALAEGELFGYRRGAFTGAERNNPGHFRSAHGGTLLLDELGDLPPSVQTKLLRVLEQREVQPLGESAPVAIDVRVVAAVQEPLERAVQEGRFRGDLYARLDGVTIRLPPLRQRRAEIPYLFSRLLVEQTGGHPPQIDARLVETLCLYDWPFNVRELKLLVKKLLVLHGGEAALKHSHLPERLRQNLAPAPTADEPVAVAAAQAPGTPIDIDALVRALRSTGGNVARAAAALGISRQRAYRLMQEHPDVQLDALRDPGGDG